MCVRVSTGREAREAGEKEGREEGGSVLSRHVKGLASYSEDRELTGLPLCSFHASCSSVSSRSNHSFETGLMKLYLDFEGAAGRAEES